MVTHRLHLSVLIVAVCAAAVTHAEITFACGKNSVNVTWRIGAELVPFASRLFLGSCMASKFKHLPRGEGEAHFNYTFNDCKFAKRMKGKRLIHKIDLSFRPQAKGKPAAITHTIECVQKRPPTWIPPFLKPGSGVSEGRGGLVVHMALLNEQLTGIAKTNIVPLGSVMPIWAAVEQKSHQPLLLLMEECVAATTPQLQEGSQVYPIISNKGCLLESKRGNALFLRRYHSSALLLYMQAFRFGVGQEVYIHCNLVVWDPEKLDETRKACHYIKELESWELLDDPNRSSLCSCCDSTCTPRSKRGVKWDSPSRRHNSVLGPLVITEGETAGESGV